jgi:Flp pilus assembly protein TadB
MGGKEKWCREQCQQAYDDCRELEGRQRQEFSTVDEAITWLKRNHQGILAGGIVVIAGVAFVTISAGAGLVVLAPAVLLAS